MGALEGGLLRACRASRGNLGRDFSTELSRRGSVGPSWDHLDGSWGCLGVILIGFYLLWASAGIAGGLFGRFSGTAWRLLVPLWDIFKPFRGSLGRLGVFLVASCSRLWAVSGSLGAV